MINFPNASKQEAMDILVISYYAVNQEDVEVVLVWKENNFKRGKWVIKKRPPVVWWS